VEYAPVGSPKLDNQCHHDPHRRFTGNGDRVAHHPAAAVAGSLVVPIPGVGEIAIGEDARTIDGNAASKRELAADGTVAAAAVDVVRATTSELAKAIGIEIKDLRVGPRSPQAVSSAASPSSRRESRRRSKPARTSW
jgi:hypothetical protein